ncbi:MAG TPA: 50S ribosomal protein L21e [Candidatus Thermoplasmatota archaeon]|jgi:large subunit ribosomal protein L21e|nr:50S ribosomal protein L21e [Candidatus Thermoplasmatota archaeon]
MVKRSAGPRSKTRHKLSRKPRDRGEPPPSHTLREFAPGAKVDVVINPSVHGGMPHSRFHGLTGTVTGKQGDCFTVALKLGRRKVKTLIARPEHLRLNGVSIKQSR